jgi:hypothetical protein
MSITFICFKMIESNSEVLHEFDFTLLWTHFGSSQIGPDSWPDEYL